MRVDRNAILTGVVALVVGAAFTYLLTLVAAGAGAIDEAHIKTVVEKMMMTPDGQTYGAVLQKVGTDIATIKADINGINRAVNILAED